MRRSKTLDLVPAEGVDEDEKPERKIKTNRPKLSYRQAMQAYFMHQGEVCQVRTCEPEAIRALIEACIPLTKRPDLAALDLAGIDLHFKTDRWFALECLESRGCKLPVYGSFEAAEKARQIAHTMGSQLVSSKV